MTEWIAAALLLAGSAFMLIAALGLVRLPDLIIRMHAAAKAGGLGVGLVVSAVAVHFKEAEVTTEAALVAAFLLLTAPVAAHLIARAAYLSGVPLWRGTVVDEMRPGIGEPPPPERDDAP
jgi:multicomponent Na+:H+ antiporter subunit G